MLSRLLGIFMILIAICGAKRTFFNEGTIKGWDRLQKDANGTYFFPLPLKSPSNNGYDF